MLPLIFVRINLFTIIFQDFEVANISSYVNKMSNLSRKYWMDRGNLVIKGASDNSNETQNISNKDKFRQFAVGRLQR